MTAPDARPPAPTDDAEPTVRLESSGESTQVFGSSGESTQRLGRGAVEPTVRLESSDARPSAPTDDAESTVRLGSSDARPPTRTDDAESTQRLESSGESTQVFGSSGESTQRLGRGPVESTQRLQSPVEPTEVLAPSVEPTEVLASPVEPTRTLHLGGITDTPAPVDAPTPVDASTPVDAPAPSGGPTSDDEYSATVLASHWIQRPEPEDSEDRTLVAPPSTQILSTPLTPPTLPDRVEGTVLRFGPGVTAAVTHRTHRTLPAVPQPAAPPRRSPRRHALPALVLICVIAFLAWQRHGPSVEVRSVAATARPAVLGCGDTADIVGLVTTNGRPGTLTYRWIRSDGTRSGVLREVVVRGQKQARVHLLWTFQGKGRHTARAELRVLSPTPHTVRARLTYDCP